VSERAAVNEKCRPENATSNGGTSATEGGTVTERA